MRNQLQKVIEIGPPGLSAQEGADTNDPAKPGNMKNSALFMVSDSPKSSAAKGNPPRHAKEKGATKKAQSNRKGKSAPSKPSPVKESAHTKDPKIDEFADITEEDLADIHKELDQNGDGKVLTYVFN